MEGESIKTETKTETKPREGDPFWSESPTILLEKDRLLEFFPVVAMSFKEKLNAITRLSIYLGILLSTFKLNLLYVYTDRIFTVDIFILSIYYENL